MPLLVAQATEAGFGEKLVDVSVHERWTAVIPGIKPWLFSRLRSTGASKPDLILGACDRLKLP